MIRERNLIFTETFTQSGDGIFYIKNFYSGLSFLKYDVDQSREKVTHYYSSFFIRNINQLDYVPS